MAQTIVGRVTTIIDADNSRLLASIKESQKAINKLTKSKTVTLGINDKAFSTKITSSKKALRDLRNKSIQISATDRVSTSVKKITNNVSKIKNKKVTISADTSNISKSANKATKDIKKIGREAKSTGQSIGKIFAGISFAAISAGIVALTKKIVDLGIEAEQTEVSFQSLLGSDVRGSQLFNSIVELASVTPFTSSQLNKAAKTLLGFGIEGENVIPTLQNIGDISAATGADIRNLALVFGQISSTGKLMGQDLNQLINAGFNPLQIISEKTGRSMSDLKADMASGLITFDQVEEAFKSATSEGGRFFQMMERQSGTVGGRLSTLRDTIQQIGRNLAKMGEGPLKGIVEALVKAAESFEKVTRGEGSLGEKAAVGGVAAAGITTVGAATVAGGAVVGSKLLDVLAKGFAGPFASALGKVGGKGADVMGKNVIANIEKAFSGVDESISSVIEKIKSGAKISGPRGGAREIINQKRLLEDPIRKAFKDKPIELNEILQEFGIKDFTADDLAKDMDKLKKAIKALVSQILDSEKELRKEAIKKITRKAKDPGGFIEDILKQSVESGKISKKSSDKLKETAKSLTILDKFSNQFKELGENLKSGNFKEASKNLKGIFDTIKANAKDIPKIMKNAFKGKGAEGGIKGFVTGSGSGIKAMFISLFASIKSAIVGVFSVVKPLVVAFGALAATITVVVASIGVWIAKINSLNKAVNGSLDEASGKAVKAGAEGLSSGDKEVTATLMDAVKGGLKAVFITPFQKLWAGLKVILTGLSPLIKFVFKQLVIGWGFWIKTILSSFGITEKQIDNFLGTLKDIPNKLVKGVTNFFRWIALDVAKHFGVTEKEFDEFTATLGDWASAITGAIGPMFKWLKDEFVDLGAAIVNAVSFGELNKQLEGAEKDISIDLVERGNSTIGLTEAELARREQARQRALEGISRRVKKRAEKAAESAAKQAKEINEFIKEGIKKYVDALFPEINLAMDIEDAKNKLEKTLENNREKAEQAIIEFQKMAVEAAERIDEKIKAGTSEFDAAEIPDIFKNIDLSIEFLGGDMSPEEILDQIPEAQLPGFTDIINRILGKPIKQIEEGFSELTAEIDISDAKEKLRNARLGDKLSDEFNAAFQKIADKKIFKERGIKSIEDALNKLPKELIPNFVSLLEKAIDSGNNKIRTRFQRFEEGREIDFAKEDIEKNKIFFEPLLEQLGFDSFEQAFLQIPDKLLPQFRDVLSKAAPDFSARLGQINRNMDIFESRMKIRERFREDNLGDLVNIPVDKIERTLREAFSKSPLEDRPEILAQIERFFPKIDRDENVGKAAPGGAFLGSVEANRILTGRQEEKTDKKIEENTKLANEYLKQISEGGVMLKNVEVAR